MIMVCEKCEQTDYREVLIALNKFHEKTWMEECSVCEKRLPCKKYTTIFVQESSLLKDIKIHSLDKTKESRVANKKRVVKRLKEYSNSIEP